MRTSYSFVLGGRYDRTKSLQQNIALTAPIMSRFDLFFVLIDECSEIADYAIAKKIVNLHSNEEEEMQRVYTQEEVMRYISFARQFQPVMNKEAIDLMVKCYTALRQKDMSGNIIEFFPIVKSSAEIFMYESYFFSQLPGYGKSSFRVTVRQLESMIRLAEAMAKMECSDEVKVKHVQEAYR